jgi:protein-disulfide isomerase
MNEESPIASPVASPKKKSVFDAFTSKASFWTGFIAGIMAFCTVGFILMMATKTDWKSFGVNNLADAWKMKPAATANANANSNGNANTNAPSNPAANLPPITSDDHVRGDLSKAKVVMVEYSDFECPYCKRFDPTIQEVFKDYGTNIAWVYRHFPLTSIHANAEKEAEASECVAELGGNDAFWKFADTIYSRTTSGGTGIALTSLGSIAKGVGVDQKKFQTCLDSGKYASKVTSEEQGGEAAGITGTPGTFVINRNGDSQLIVGAETIDHVKAVIDSLLK